MTDSIIDISKGFFEEYVRPILATQFPDEFAQMACGVWGLGSEALRLDDGISRDHHFGLRIDAIMPLELLQARWPAVQAALEANLPHEYQGHTLGERAVVGAGITPESLRGFLTRTIGFDHPPQTDQEWLSIPEEDVIHVLNGEVWHDPSGRFTAVRTTLEGYYPEPVRLRRLAHWCRYYSGMGVYALKRALLRDNEYYASVTFAKALRWGIQMAFMLDKVYYPYDKWTMAFFKRLPRMHGRLQAIVDEAVKHSTSWDRRLELLDRMSDQLDATMTEDGIVPPHPKFRGSPTSGYRLMEYDYYQIIRNLPYELLDIIPEWEQVHLERSVVHYVAGLDEPAWREALNLTAVED